MVRVFFADVFDSKVVDDERKNDGLRFVLPKARSVLDGVITESVETLDE